MQAAKLYLPRIKRRGDRLLALLYAGDATPEVDFLGLEGDEFQVAALVSSRSAGRSSVLERLLKSKVDSKIQIEVVHLLLQSPGGVTEDFFLKALAGLMQLIGAVHGAPLSDLGIIFMHSVQLVLAHIESPDPASLAPYLEVLRTTAVRQSKDLFPVGGAQPTACLLFSMLCQLLGRTHSLLGADEIANEIAEIASLIAHVALSFAIQSLMSLCDVLRHTYPNQMGQFLDGIVLNSLDRIFIVTALAARPAGCQDVRRKQVAAACGHLQGNALSLESGHPGAVGAARLEEPRAREQETAFESEEDSANRNRFGPLGGDFDGRQLIQSRVAGIDYIANYFCS
jgi:hypothetical protein